MWRWSSTWFNSVERMIRKWVYSLIIRNDYLMLVFYFSCLIPFYVKTVDVNLQNKPKKLILAALSIPAYWVLVCDISCTTNYLYIVLTTPTKDSTWQMNQQSWILALAQTSLFACSDNTDHIILFDSPWRVRENNSG